MSQKSIMNMQASVNDPSTNGINPDEMTSRDFYFDLGAHFGTHEAILKDKIRMTTFRDVIYHNRDLFKGKIVMDVGSGTGILSMFAAEAGAARVFSIECSKIAHHAEKIIKENNFDKIITLIRGKVEDITLPDGIEKVDIIVSDCIGQCLFHESQLSSVIFARDKWLDRKNGLILPDRCSLYISGIEDQQYKDEKIDWWNEVYEFDMSAIRNLAITEPIIATVSRDQIVTTSFLVKKINLHIVTKEDLSFSRKFRLVARRDDQIHALVAYFDVDFLNCHTKMGFSTSPHSLYTRRLKQTIFYIDDQIIVKKDEKLFGVFSIKQDEKNKNLDFTIELCINNNNSKVEQANKYYFRMD